MTTSVAAEASEIQNALASMRGIRAWLITDDKAGNRTQGEGVLDALGAQYVIKPVQPGRLQRLLSPYVPVARSERFGEPGSTFAPPWPELAIAIGRLAIPYLRALRRRAGRHTYTVILLDPKVPLASADLFWMPEHDRRRGPNVVTTLTAPHRYSPQRLAALRAAPLSPALASLPQPRLAVLLGGNSKAYRFTPTDIDRLASALAALKALGAGLMITPSRRTPSALLTALTERLTGPGTLIWDGAGENPYPAMLAHADGFVVTADSVNMCGEPTVTGRPVHVFFPTGGHAKLARFHEALARHGATRPLPDRPERLESWSYRPLYSASVIAAEIALRMARRRRLLGALAAP